jgi:hypothetical protein
VQVGEHTATLRLSPRRINRCVTTDTARSRIDNEARPSFTAAVGSDTLVNVNQKLAISTKYATARANYAAARESYNHQVEPFDRFRAVLNKLGA